MKFFVGRIGHEFAPLGLDMHFIPTDISSINVNINVTIHNSQSINVGILTKLLFGILKHYNFITMHVPVQKDVFFNYKNEF